MDALARRLWFDVDRLTFVRGVGALRGRPQMSLSEALGHLPFGVPTRLELAYVREVEARRWAPVDYRGTWLPTLKIQRLFMRPDRCSFVLRYEGEETALLDFNLTTLQEVEDALNALTTVEDLGGVRVLPCPYLKGEDQDMSWWRTDESTQKCQPASGRFMVVWNNPGGTAGISDERSDLEIGIEDSWPVCYPFVERVNEAAKATDRQAYVVYFLEQRLAQIQAWNSSGGSTATVTRIVPGTATAPETQRVSISPTAANGDFRLRVSTGCQTDWITVGSSAWDVSCALNKLTCHNEYFHVVSADKQAWDVTFSTVGGKSLLEVDSRLGSQLSMFADIEWNADLSKQLLGSDPEYRAQAEFTITHAGSGQQIVSRQQDVCLRQALS